MFFIRSRFFAHIIGKRCQVCSRVLEGVHHGIMLCSNCSDQLAPRKGGYCAMCARVYALDDESTHLCLDCRLKPVFWNAIAFYAVYQGLLRDMIIRYKFNADLGLGSVLGSLLYEAASKHHYEYMDWIIPVPLHYRRLQSRGFNQSLELSRILGKKTKLPVLKDALVKIRHTPPQSSMGRKSRLKSLKGVFQVRTDIVRNSGIILVDDIMTTGSTLKECSKVLLKAGAADIRVAILSRAV
ncbi:MAG: ComF family protein [Desulfonatronovibrio sp.]